jgi:hypothetical protein
MPDWNEWVYVFRDLDIIKMGNLVLLQDSGLCKIQQEGARPGALLVE